MIIPDTVVFESQGKGLYWRRNRYSLRLNSLGGKSNQIKFWLFNPCGKLKKKFPSILRKKKETVQSIDGLLKKFTGYSMDDLNFAYLNDSIQEKVLLFLDSDYSIKLFQLLGGDSVFRQVQK
jgi:hypothetical protein